MNVTISDAVDFKSVDYDGNMANKLYCSLNFLNMLRNQIVCNELFVYIDF
jgi:hypothetical protein